MNYYAAREIADANGKPSGRYHFTCENDGRIWPVGYCASRWGCPSCKGLSGKLRPDVACATCGSTGLVPADPLCLGHASAEEAREHYRQYLLDCRLHLGSCPETELHKCEFPDGCETFTRHSLTVDHGSTWYLCDEHRLRSVVGRLYPEVGEIWSS
jgi:hypothetical protein